MAKPRFLVTLSIEMPAEDGMKAMESVMEFFQMISVGGSKVNFTIEDVTQVGPDVPQED